MTDLQGLSVYKMSHHYHRLLSYFCGSSHLTQRVSPFDCTNLEIENKNAVAKKKIRYTEIQMLIISHSVRYL